MDTLFLSRLKLYAIEVFKCINNVNPSFMNVFTKKDVKYNLRDNRIVCLPTFNTVTHGQKCFKYYGSHLWNHVPIMLKNALNVSSFKRLIKTWDGPNCQCKMCQDFI